MQPQSNPPTTPPPGWYPDQHGWPRWWDGVRWGPAAAPPPPPRSVEESGKALAIISWLGFLVAYGLVALVVRIVERDGNRFARWHAAEALNLQLTALLVSGVGAVPAWIWMIVTFDETSTSAAPPLGFFLAWAVLMLVGLAGLTVVILGAVRAGQGTWWRCPVAIPFLRRHRRERLAELGGGGS